MERAREEDRRLGIPNASSQNGTLSFERPDRTITQKDPFGEENADGSPAD